MSMMDQLKIQATKRILYELITTHAHTIVIAGFCFSFFLQTTTQANSDFGPVTSTEKYRISRKELGYILGRNYRGLKKLWNVEINDALNVRSRRK